MEDMEDEFERARDYTIIRQSGSKKNASPATVIVYYMLSPA